MTSGQTASLPANEKTWLGHPRGLAVLFATEMWERFSYYGMRALLIMYMTDYLFINAEKGQAVLGYETLKAMVTWIIRSTTTIQGDVTIQMLSSQFYGLYTGFVYLTPFFGGILADRVFGQRKSVYIGGVLMAIGHFLMASEHLFFVALFFLILGNGCFKPNISTQVGALYAPGDARRDSAFTLFYMGINLGAFFSPLICGTLGQKVGWHWGFGAAGIGMLCGLAIYHFGRHLLPPDNFEAMKASNAAAPNVTKDEWGRIGALVFLCLVNVLFWAVYEQQGNTLQLWADEFTDWVILGWEMPSSWYQSFNPLFIFIFAPILGRFWLWQARRGKEPGSVTKMGLGCVQLGLAFVIMIFSVKGISSGKVSPMWLAVSTWLMTMGELYLSPIGLSLVTKVAPARMVSMMMGMWFLSSFLGNYLSGWIGGFYNVMPKEAFFGLLTVMGLGAGIVFFVIQKPLQKRMGPASH